MNSRRITFLLVLITMIFCGCSKSNKETKGLQLEANNYKELSMNSIVDVNVVNKIVLFYQGKDYIISDPLEIKKVMENWEESNLTDANVSLLKEDLPPGFLYTITLKMVDDNRKVYNDYVFTVIRQEDTNLDITYTSPDKKEYYMVGTANESFISFLEECMECKE